MRKIPLPNLLPKLFPFSGQNCSFRFEVLHLRAEFEKRECRKEHCMDDPLVNLRRSWLVEKGTFVQSVPGNSIMNLQILLASPPVKPPLHRMNSSIRDIDLHLVRLISARTQL